MEFFIKSIFIKISFECDVFGTVALKLFKEEPRIITTNNDIDKRHNHWIDFLSIIIILYYTRI